jgi:hypothetical protein
MILPRHCFPWEHRHLRITQTGKQFALKKRPMDEKCHDWSNHLGNRAAGTGVPAADWLIPD